MHLQRQTWMWWISPRWCRWKTRHRRQDPSGAFPGAWLSALCLHVCCRSDERGGGQSSPLCLGIMPSSAGEPEHHRISLTATREKVQVALSLPLPPAARHLHTCRNTLLPLELPRGGSEASEEGRNLQLWFRTMKCAMLIWLVHKIAVLRPSGKQKGKLF